MSTDAKRAGNARYLAKFAELKIRITPERKESIVDAAKAAGMSTAAYIIAAIDAQMERDAKKS